jgi:hypothetical protein
VVKPEASQLAAKMSVLVGPLVSVKPFAPMFERTTPACAGPAAKNAMAIKANAKNLDFIKTNLQKTYNRSNARHDTPGLTQTVYRLERSGVNCWISCYLLKKQVCY